MHVERIINSPVPSNSYVLFDEKITSCVVIDPGTPGCDQIIDFCDRNHLVPTYIILTHEHFDHVWGCDTLRNRYNSKIICSKTCSEKIEQPRNYFNLLYFNKDEMFKVEDVDIILEDVNYSIEWNEYSIYFLQTPGHSSSSICFFIENNLFTGDTLMKGYKPFFKRKDGGSLESLKQSVNMIYNIFSLKGTTVFPGHGDEFILDDYEFIDII